VGCLLWSGHHHSWACAEQKRSERTGLGDTVSVGSVKPSGEILHWVGDVMRGPLNYVQPLRTCEEEDAVFLDVRK